MPPLEVFDLLMRTPTLALALTPTLTPALPLTLPLAYPEPTSTLAHPSPSPSPNPNPKASRYRLYAVVEHAGSFHGALLPPPHYAKLIRFTNICPQHPNQTPTRQEPIQT